MKQCNAEGSMGSFTRSDFEKIMKKMTYDAGAQT